MGHMDRFTICTGAQWFSGAFKVLGPVWDVLQVKEQEGSPLFQLEFLPRRETFADGATDKRANIQIDFQIDLHCLLAFCNFSLLSGGVLQIPYKVKLLSPTSSPSAETLSLLEKVPRANVRIFFGMLEASPSTWGCPLRVLAK